MLSMVCRKKPATTKMTEQARYVEDKNEKEGGIFNSTRLHHPCQNTPCKNRRHMEGKAQKWL